ncbi:hypothetical protein JMN32_10165 [Fulvivirga sp. 29W222]|uniref:Uncharacterized protein n=1 Tax=Fulvivirga marina TaxID=2494733 RepID=A0A937FX73_9BACT|nr:hypothetical protein [Fulvivirga marina]MBL6446677.1 hypothetical protein [Fulvivirga marina]
MKSIKTSKKFTQKQTNLGYFFLVASIILVFAGRVEMVAVAILHLVVAYNQKDKDLIKIEKDHLEIKLSLLSSTRFIKFSDITKVEEVNPKKVFLHYNEGPKSKKLRIPVHMIEPIELEDFLTFINNKLKPVPDTSL